MCENCSKQTLTWLVVLFLSMYAYRCMHGSVHKWYHTISVSFVRNNIKPATLWGVDWPYCPGRNAENGPLHTCIYSGGKIWNLSRLTYFYTYICMHKWFYAKSIPFIRVKIKLVMLFLVFGWPHGLGRGAGNGPSYTCICSGGQMEKLSRVTYMHYMSFQTQFYRISTRFRPFWTHFVKIFFFTMRPLLEWHIFDICPASDIYDICGDIYGWHMALIASRSLVIEVYVGGLWPLLLTWFNFNPSMDK